VGRRLFTTWWDRSAKAPIVLDKERELAVRDGDLLAVMSAGGYAMGMSSSYNIRPRAAEVMVDRTRTHLVRERERPEALFALERILR